MTTQDQDNARALEKSVYYGEMHAFYRIERMLSDRKETLSKILRKQKEAKVDHPCAQRVLEIGMFLDEIHILKRQTREAHAETLTK